MCQNLFLASCMQFMSILEANKQSQVTVLLIFREKSKMAASYMGLRLGTSFWWEVSTTPIEFSQWTFPCNSVLWVRYVNWTSERPKLMVTGRDKHSVSKCYAPKYGTWDGSPYMNVFLRHVPFGGRQFKAHCVDSRVTGQKNSWNMEKNINSWGKTRSTHDLNLEVCQKYSYQPWTHLIWLCVSLFGQLAQKLWDQ